MLVMHYLSCAITFLLVFYMLWVLVDIPLKHFCKGLLKPVYRNLIGITVSLVILINFFNISSPYK